jgi:hypothetical protein
MEILNFQDWGNPKSFWKGLVLGIITFGIILTVMIIFIK